MTMRVRQGVLERAGSLGLAVIALALLLAVLGCREPPGREGRREGAQPAQADTGADPLVERPTIYSTHFLFLATEGRSPVGLSMHFVALAEPGRYVRDYRGWLLADTSWTGIAEIHLEEPPTRGPWRIFPAAGLRLIVGEQGELRTLIQKGPAGDARLTLGMALDRFEDPDAARRQIRHATLQLAGSTVSGILLEEQVARLGPGVAPLYRSHETAVLHLGRDDLLIFSQQRDSAGYGSSFAWASLGGVNRRWDRVTVEGVNLQADTAGGRTLPARWTITIPEPGLEAELVATGYETSPAGAGRRGLIHAVYAVRGWIDAEGRRRDARGILERGEP